MVGIIIAIIIIPLFFWLGLVLAKKNYDGLGDTLFIIGILCSIVFCSLLLGRDSRSKIENDVLIEYMELSNRVEKVSTFPPEVKAAIDTCFPEFKMRVNEMNDRIERNKTYLNNPYNGWLMSEKIASLKSLTYE